MDLLIMDDLLRGGSGDTLGVLRSLSEKTASSSYLRSIRHGPGAWFKPDGLSLAMEAGCLIFITGSARLRLDVYGLGLAIEAGCTILITGFAGLRLDFFEMADWDLTGA